MGECRGIALLVGVGVEELEELTKKLRSYDFLLIRWAGLLCQRLLEVPEWWGVTGSFLRCEEGGSVGDYP